jgi:hypothetical protein
MTSDVHVNTDNFRAAETARMFDSILKLSGGVNTWFHYRAPTPIDKQPVVRMNRDTLYSVAVVDIREGAEVALPDTGDRYFSVMVVNGEHYINEILREPGIHSLSQAIHATPFVLLAARTFVDPQNADDIAAVNAVQDAMSVNAASNGPYSHPDYDEVSMTQTRDALAVLGRGLGDTSRMFGRKADVEPTRHLIGTATAWGGLPETEAYYYIETDPRPAGRYTLTMSEVPVDAFWSVTAYNRDGFFEANQYETYNVNSVTAVPEADGSVIVTFAPDDSGPGNHLYIDDGWNYGLRLYRPGPAVLDKSWTPPVVQPLD